ncbi:MAG: protein kinase [Coriobacteriaceae bacterium]|nr:protein kinase [Coriobacteriaceae bacterium]MCI6548055.1 protein kinase [Coriobacteriaceae bacterium]MCI6845199.1 protein kinase [Coriobacteriaceae bacterium]MCI7438633.1 protein kinase [Coriobacteriaceae bacterium]MDD7584810.1 protein kinase [Coriobacteriaceae bacterium]
MGAPEDERLMATLEKDEAYRVERVLASSEVGSTEIVSRSGIERLGEGPLVRKRIKRDVANAEVFSRLSTMGGAHLPRVVEAYDLPDQLVIVREYVYGASLAACVSEAGRMGEAAAAGVVADVCDAIAALHEQGIVHRDVSPKNVILSPRGAVPIDLGIARTYVEGAQRDTTRLGTWGFASPEQYGFAQTDVRSDVYSVGCLFGYMLTGVTPDADAYEAILSDATVVRPELRIIVEKACSFEPSERYQSAGALKDAVLQAVPDAAAASVSRTSGRATSPNARDNDYLALVTPVQLLGVFRASDGARRLSSIAVALFGVLLGALFAFAAFQAITFPGQQYPVTLMLLMLFIGAYLALLCVVEAPAAILGAGKYGAGGHAGASGRLAILGKWALFGVSVLGVAFFVLLVFAVVLNV